MSDSNHKETRKAVRHIVKEILPEVLTSELGKAVESASTKAVHERCDKIESFCQETLKQQEQRSRAIHGWLVGEVKNNIAQQSANTSLTLEAFLRLASEIFPLPADFKERLEKTKADITEEFRKQKERELIESTQSGEQSNAATEQA